MAELVIVRVSLQIAWSLLSNQLVKRLENRGESDEKFRKLLLDKFQKLHEELSSLRRKELVAAVSFMENGYELFLQDPVEAKKEFTKARDAAQMAFGVVSDTCDKLLATKIMLASAMHEFDEKTDTAMSLCLKYVSRLNQLPEIIDACVTYNKKGLLGKLRSITGSVDRHDNLKTLSEINRNVWQFVIANNPGFNKQNWPFVRFDDTHFNAVCDLIPLREPQQLSNDPVKTRGTPIAMVSHGNSLFVAYSLHNATTCDSCDFLEAINLETLESKQLAGHSGMVLCLAGTHGKIYSGSYDKTILVWDASSQTLLAKLGEHRGSVRSLVANKIMLFSAATDMLIKVWDIESGECHHILSGHKYPISILTFTHHLFSYAPGEGIYIWKVGSWEILSIILDPGNVTSMFCSVRSKLFAHCGNDVKIWNLGHFKEDGIVKDVGKLSVYIPGTKIISATDEKLFHFDLRTSRCLYNQPMKLTKLINITVMSFNYESGFLYLGGLEQETKKGVVLCL